jgi:tRNA (mo5U34)-methyltransferase
MSRLSRTLAPADSEVPRIAREIVLPLGPQRLCPATTPFDQPHYRQLIEARGATLSSVLRKLQPLLSLKTALDAGCGVGFFSQMLADMHLSVAAFDGRAENVSEARRRFPSIPFETADVQDSAVRALGSFDLALCFGLLYHLENPFQAIRNLRALTGKCLLLESMCAPGERSELLLREEPCIADQSLTDMACYPSESGLVKMLYRSGFAKVYRVVPLPNHDDFRDTAEHVRRRTMLLASLIPVDVAGFRLMPEPQESPDPWLRRTKPTLTRRLWRFAKSPARSKYITLATRLRCHFPRLAIPWRLPFGAWWRLEGSALDAQLLRDEFESASLRFVERFLRPGMTVLDIGAHHGLYTLLASARVRRAGCVLAFEPSARERSRLQRHLRLNRCKNVQVLPFALGAEQREADFYLVEGHLDFCNSLRLPDVPEPLQSTRAQIRTLDDLLEEKQVATVDLVKLDVEGGERDVLTGAQRLLHRLPRPVFLVEVEDRRTKPWKYPAKEIIDRLSSAGFQWHSVEDSGNLRPLDINAAEFEGNFVAVPAERAAEMASFTGVPGRSLLTHSHAAKPTHPGAPPTDLR